MVALVEAARAVDYPAEIVLVVSDKPGAAGIGKAQSAGISTVVVDRSTFPDKAAFEAALQAEMESAGVEFICLAGFMRILSAEFVARWSDRILNIHPSILPAFRGIDTHQRVVDAGVRLHGCTVHFVRAEVDTGPIVGQAAIPVLPDDTAETVSDRLLEVEHRLYPAALAWVASGRARLQGERVIWEGMPDQTAATLIVPAPGDGP